MAFCSNCGAAVEGRFCQKCGAAVSSGATGEYVPPQQATAFNAAGIPANIVSTLCYVVPFVCAIIFLVVEPYKNDRKVRFDAFQALFVWVAYVAIRILISILGNASGELSYELDRLLYLALFLLLAFLAIKAFQNQKVVLPVIGPLAEKQA